jgi:hypothetical protein
MKKQYNIPQTELVYCMTAKDVCQIGFNISGGSAADAANGR